MRLNLNMSKKEITIKGPRERSMQIVHDSLNEDSRSVDVVFATESPVLSYLPEVGEYNEVLVCDESACDMGRVRSGAQFCKEHDRMQVIGVVENVRFENAIGYATLRYAKTALGEEEWGMMKDGIRKNFSVSYKVRRLAVDADGGGGLPTGRAVAWEPLEISAVSVPADPNCRAIRSDGENHNIEIQTKQMKQNPHLRTFLEADKGGSTGEAPSQSIDINAERASIRAALLATNKEINDAASLFQRSGHDVAILASKATNEGWTADKFREEAVNNLNSRSKSQATAPTIEVIGERHAPQSLGSMLTASESYRSANGSARRAMSTELGNYEHSRATSLLSGITGYTGTHLAQSVAPFGLQRLTIADLIGQGTTSLTSVTYWTEDSFTNSAGMVAEGGAKPDGDIPFTERTAPVKKIAVINKVSTEMFDDQPMLSSHVDNRLIYMVKAKLEQQILSGSGSGANLTGILNTAGIQTTAVQDDDNIGAIHAAKTLINAVGQFTPEVIVINPYDWEKLRLAKDGSGQYYAGGPFTGAYNAGGYQMEQSIWGLIPVVTTAVPVGTALVGNFKLGATLFTRKGISFDTTGSNEDDFIKNLIAVRAEMRAALPVWAPKAFCTVTGIV